MTESSNSKKGFEPHVNSVWPWGPEGGNSFQVKIELEEDGAIYNKVMERFLLGEIPPQALASEMRKVGLVIV